MISNDEAKAIIDAIEDYGDTERMYGKKSQQLNHGGREEDSNYYNSLADHKLGVIAQLIRPHIEDPSVPGLRDRYPEGIKPRPEPPATDEPFEVKSIGEVGEGRW